MMSVIWSYRLVRFTESERLVSADLHKRKRALLRKFGSLKNIREAPVEEIASTLGFTAALAEKVKEYL